MSWRGKCAECANAAILDNLHQLSAHAGPRFNHWRQRLAASVGAPLVDAREHER